jgi:hypothetical protein
MAHSVLRWSIATIVATAVHHVYGGVFYRTPWRIHGAAAALALAVVLWALTAAFIRGRRLTSLAGVALAVIALTGPIMAIGLFEGAYNHGVKDVLFLAGLSPEMLRRIFPPPRYELPNDVVFETTELAQVMPAIMAARVWFQWIVALFADAADANREGGAVTSRPAHPLGRGRRR